MCSHENRNFVLHEMLFAFRKACLTAVLWPIVELNRPRKFVFSRVTTDF